MRRVIKVGGSLLSRADLIESLPHWLDQQSPAQNVLIFGGGELVDAIRNLDRLRPSESAVVHWRCVDLLQVTFQMAADWFSAWSTVDSRDLLAALAAVGAERPVLVSVRSFYRPDVGSSLPLTWDTTTDAIAAELAVRCEADELVLLKSCEVDPGADVDSLAEAGIVDLALPLIAPAVRSVRVAMLPPIG